MTLSDFGCSCDDCPVPTIEPIAIRDLEAAFVTDEMIVGLERVGTASRHRS